jgi:arsenate reductase
MIYPKLADTIEQLNWTLLEHEDSSSVLQPLIVAIQEKVDKSEAVNLNFICTHNSRRSHLSQVWAQVASEYFNIPKVYCYSGGTEETALFPKVAETLAGQGLHIFKLSEAHNPVYAIKYDDNALPVIGFSKKYDSPFNPVSKFIAILTCSQADGGCPFIAGADKRFPVTFEDPKTADHTPDQTRIYAERSLEIARSMFYVFSKINQ